MAGRDYTGTVIALGYTEKATGKGNMIFFENVLLRNTGFYNSRGRYFAMYHFISLNIR